MLLVMLTALQTKVVVYACKPSIQEAEAGGSQVQGQPRLQIGTLSQNSKNQNQANKNKIPTLQFV
jgi:hypothetical protein